MDIGKSIHQRRTGLGLTLETLAERSGVSRAMLSEIERGTKNPTIKVVCQIAEGLGCTVSALLGEETSIESMRAPVVVRRDERQVLVDPRTGVERHTLAPAFLRRGIEILWYEVPVGEHVGPFAPHQPGVEEHITVVRGRMRCCVADEELILEEGDSIFFRADVVHDCWNIGESVCNYFLIINSSGVGEHDHKR